MAKRHYSSSRMSGKPEPDTVSGKERMHKGKGSMNEGEYHASGMISDDWSAPALLPRHTIEKYWPAGQSYMNHTEADLFTGVNKGLQEDSREYHGAFKPGKY